MGKEEGTRGRSQVGCWRYGWTAGSEGVQRASTERLALCSFQEHPTNSMEVVSSLSTGSRFVFKCMQSNKRHVRIGTLRTYEFFRSPPQLSSLSPAFCRQRIVSRNELIESFVFRQTGPVPSAYYFGAEVFPIYHARRRIQFSRVPSPKSRKRLRSLPADDRTCNRPPRLRFN